MDAAKPRFARFRCVQFLRRLLWYYFSMESTSHGDISHTASLEAVLFAAGESVSKKRLATLLEITPEQLRDSALDLRTKLEGRGLALIEAGEELELRTAPHAAGVVQKLRESELSRDLGKASLEALAIILYKGGATRSEIDWVRGVNSAAALRSLTLRGLIARAEDASDRRRIRYTATIDALAHLGVASMQDLPRYSEFAAALSSAQESATSTDGAENTNELSNATSIARDSSSVDTAEISDEA
jgi:segregation and condensation protein B